MPRFPMNLQFFAEPAGEREPAGQSAAAPQGAPQGQAGQQTASPVVDYAKIKQMLEGTLAAKEDTALKAYFKQQGLSQQEAEQAMTAFKLQKEALQPDVNALQAQAAQARAAAQKAMIDSAAIMAAASLGIGVKTIPYVLKMADLSQAAGADGQINEDALKAALNKVLEDVPALRPSASEANGFVQVGAAGGQQQTQATDDALKKAFGL